MAEQEVPVLESRIGPSAREQFRPLHKPVVVQQLETRNSLPRFSFLQGIANGEAPSNLLHRVLDAEPPNHEGFEGSPCPPANVLSPGSAEFYCSQPQASPASPVRMLFRLARPAVVITLVEIRFRLWPGGPSAPEPGPPRKVKFYTGSYRNQRDARAVFEVPPRAPLVHFEFNPSAVVSGYLEVAFDALPPTPAGAFPDGSPSYALGIDSMAAYGVPVSPTYLESYRRSLATDPTARVTGSAPSAYMLSSINTADRLTRSAQTDGATPPPTRRGLEPLPDLILMDE